jgi:hypothetical protein
MERSVATQPDDDEPLELTEELDPDAEPDESDERGEDDDADPNVNDEEGMKRLSRSSDEPGCRVRG